MLISVADKLPPWLISSCGWFNNRITEVLPTTSFHELLGAGHTQCWLSSPHNSTFICIFERTRWYPTICQNDRMNLHSTKNMEVFPSFHIFINPHCCQSFHFGYSVVSELVSLCGLIYIFWWLMRLNTFSYVLQWHLNIPFHNMCASFSLILTNSWDNQLIKRKSSSWLTVLEVSVQGQLLLLSWCLW